MDQGVEPYVVPAAPYSSSAPWEKLDSRYPTMARLSGAISAGTWAAIWFVLIVGVVTLTPLPSQYRIPAFVLWAAVAVLRGAWSQYRPILTYRHSSFRLDGETIEIRRGVFFRRIISVPRSRVQHTDVSQGPFERRYELGTLHIYTAGVSHAHVPLQGLAHTRAIEIRDALLPRDRVART